MLALPNLTHHSLLQYEEERVLVQAQRAAGCVEAVMGAASSSTLGSGCVENCPLYSSNHAAYEEGTGAPEPQTVTLHICFPFERFVYCDIWEKVEIRKDFLLSAEKHPPHHNKLFCKCNPTEPIWMFLSLRCAVLIYCLQDLSSCYQTDLKWKCCMLCWITSHHST